MEPICTPHELATLLHGIEVLRVRVNELEAAVERVRTVLARTQDTATIISDLWAVLPKEG